MARGKKGDQRRVVSPLAAAGTEHLGAEASIQSGDIASIKAATEWYGKQRAQLVDISTQMENIFTLTQEQNREVSRQYGIEKDLLNLLEVKANKEKIIEQHRRLLNDLSLEEQNIVKETIKEYEDYNREAAGVAQKTKELLSFRQKQIPFEDKIRSIGAEIKAQTEANKKNETDLGKERLENLKTQEKQYLTLSKQAEMNDRIEKTQQKISEAMSLQGTFAGQIFQTFKDIVTNPLLIFTGLLALGAQRYEEMRQRGNQLAEEMERVDKALAGAGPYQEKIIRNAERIRKEFRRAGEGFSSSMENAVAAVQALEAQLGNVDFISGNIVDQMSKLKLSIGLTDEESAKVMDNFMLMSNLSEDAAINASNLTYHMSETVGLNPAVVFQDIANASAETLAHFTGGSQQIAKAAVEARRMGITLQDVANISKSLLDFESSIEAEMEAQMLTGMNLNFNRARMFAMNKQGGKAAKEVLRQVGGLERFQKMNIFQQEAIAKATGLNLDQLLKSNVQRERENKLARDKDKLVGKQLEMATRVTRLMGQVDAGLSLMQEISKVLGDLFLDVFGGGMKEMDKWFREFIHSDAFQNTVTSILRGVKSVISWIASLFKSITDSPLFQRVSNWMGGGTFSTGRQSFDSDLAASRQAGALKVALGGFALFKLGSWVMPMWVKIKGGLSGLLGGGGAGSGLASLLGGGGGATFGGMKLGGLLGGTASSGSMALGGTALGTVGTVAGSVLGLAAIGKGVYDVATIKSHDTSREKAKDYGGLGGAATGALTGAAIGSVVPVVGTVLGAGIGAVFGYFGGRAVGAMDAFRDDIDVMRDNMLENQTDITNNLNKQMDTNNRRMMLKNAMATESFLKLSNEAGDVTGDALKQLQSDLVDTGFISKEMFRQMAKDGKITQDEMNRMLSTITGNISVQEDFFTDANEEEQAAYDRIQETNKRLAAEKLELEKDIAALMNYTKDLTELAPSTFIRGTDVLFPMDQTGGYKEGGEPGGSFGYASNYMMNDVAMEKFMSRVISQMQITVGKDALTKEQWDEILAKMDSQRYQNMDNDLTINQALQNVSDLAVEMVNSQLTKNLKDNTAVITDLNTATEDVTTITTDNVNEVDSLINATENNTDSLNNLDNTLQENKIEAQKNKTVYDKSVDALVKDPVANLLLKNPAILKYVIGWGRGGVLPTYAGGGITYGPSHAQGGIPTAYGELEGGEAVINKRSTAMYAGLLSRINQAGGGRSFAAGGTISKFAGGGIANHMIQHILESAPLILSNTYAQNEAIGKGVLGAPLANYQFSDAHNTDNALRADDKGAKGLHYLDYFAAGLEGLNVAAMPFTGGAGLKVAGVGLGTIGMSLGIVALLGIMMYKQWANSFMKNQKELANHGGLTKREAETLFNLLAVEPAGGELTSKRLSEGFGGHGFSKGMNALFDEWYQTADAARSSDRVLLPGQNRAAGQSGRNSYWAPFLNDEGQNIGEPYSSAHMRYYYGKDPSQRKYWPDELAYIRSNLGLGDHYKYPGDSQEWVPRKKDIDPDIVNYGTVNGATRAFISHGRKDRNTFVKALAKSLGGIKGFIDPMAGVRHSAVMTPDDKPGSGYTDPYGYGPIPGATGYRLRNTTGEEDYTWSPDQELYDVIGLKARKKGGDPDKWYKIAEQSGGDLLNLVEDVGYGHKGKGRKGGWSSRLPDHKIYHGSGVPGQSYRGQGKSHKDSAQYYGSAQPYAHDSRLKPNYMSGGFLANSPITKVNDMILTADGQMIQTHPDDNIIAKKGGITQKSGGGKSRVEELLEGILIATQEGHIITIDGAKISSAINTANHNV